MTTPSSASDLNAWGIPNEGHHCAHSNPRLVKDNDKKKKKKDCCVEPLKFEVLCHAKLEKWTDQCLLSESPHHPWRSLLSNTCLTILVNSLSVKYLGSMLFSQLEPYWYPSQAGPIQNSQERLKRKKKLDHMLVFFSYMSFDIYHPLVF